MRQGPRCRVRGQTSILERISPDRADPFSNSNAAVKATTVSGIVVIVSRIKCEASREKVMVEWLVVSAVLRLSCYDRSLRWIKATDKRTSTSTVMVGPAGQLGGVRVSCHERSSLQGSSRRRQPKNNNSPSAWQTAKTPLFRMVGFFSSPPSLPPPSSLNLP